MITRLGKVVNKAKLKSHDLKSYIENERKDSQKTQDITSSVDAKDVSV
jgi:hypothetical protein